MHRIKTKTLIFIGLFLIIITILFFAYDLGFIFPPKLIGGTTIYIGPDESFSDIAGDLERKGIIRSANDFVLFVHLSGNMKKIRPGEFSFSESQFENGISVLDVIEFFR
ncbi:MAG: hypothetical protein AAB783_01780 [Patescibacteria group bacterium]